MRRVSLSTVQLAAIPVSCGLCALNGRTAKAGRLVGPNGKVCTSANADHFCVVDWSRDSRYSLVREIVGRTESDNTIICAADRWRGIQVGEFEQRQLRALREELDRAHTQRVAPAAAQAMASRIRKVRP